MDKIARGLFGLAFSLTCATSALAGSGPTKLKQPNSFPIVISKPGSYVLVSNITVPDANTTAISITADNVTLDLGGFSIMGPVACSGTPTTCSPANGSGSGISGSSQMGLAVRNGTVRGMGNDGVLLGDQARVESVTATSNGANGINIGNNIAGTVTNSTGSVNGDNGILATTVTGCEADQNSADGIIALTVSNSSAYGNGGGVGIMARSVMNCTATNNAATGIEGDVVSNSAAVQNGFYGIAGSTVANSQALANGAIGITTLLATGCEAHGNTGSPQIAASGTTGHNICSGIPCP